MSMIWTSNMPLLSTLAALVIIVHSAEEDLDPGYRRDLSPRVMDPGIISNEQPWKAIDAVPQSTHILAEPLDEPKVRRRPLRKRRRRPHSSREPQQDEDSQNPYLDLDYDSSQTKEFPRRRRKRPDVRVYRYPEEQADTKTRPLRKLSLRKKRPTIRSYPKLSELNGWDSMELNQEENYRTEPTKNDDSEEVSHKYYGGPDFYSEVQPKPDYNTHFDNSEEMRGNQNVPTRVEMNEDNENVPKNSSLRVSYREPDAAEDLERSEELHLNTGLHTALSSTKTERRKLYRRPNTFSEFSVEDIIDKKFETKNNNQNTYVTDPPGQTYPTDLSDPTDPFEPPRKLQMEQLDAVSLKQILKRSNGTSLSEILQRHNLSLTDLLQGKGEAIFSIKKAPITEPPNQGSSEIGELFHEESHENTHQLKEVESQVDTHQDIIPRKQQKLLKTSTKTDEDAVETTTVPLDTNRSEKVVNIKPEIPEKKFEEVTERPQMIMIAKRQFSDRIQRRLRMRPTFNTTLKAQLGRDLALNARKYSLDNKVAPKAKEWKDIIPMMTNRTSLNENNIDDVTEIAPTTTDKVVETTISDWENYTSYSSFLAAGNTDDNEVENNSISVTEPTTTIIIELFPGETLNYTDKPPVKPIVRHAVNNSMLRLQSLNNRLKRKRLKQNVTPNAAVGPRKSFYGMPNLESISEFIERTPKPYMTVTQNSTESATELEDFMTTQTPQPEEIREKPTRINMSRFLSTSMTKAPMLSSTTEQSAKVEIEEILNDTMTSERLGKILKERNMTLGELVAHRERGSSFVHLADIFHNASKEPNPTEPFLTKSSIEPISKEIYPLRAILEANTHDSSNKPTNVQTTMAPGNYNHIPVTMDFGNNVNENGETIGILPLFGNTANTAIRQDSDGTPYVSSVVSLNITINNTDRESRVLGEPEDDDEWRKVLAIMHHNNITTKMKQSPKTKTDRSQLREVVAVTIPHDGNIMKAEKDKLKSLVPDKTSVEVADEEGFIILEDLRHLKDFDSNIASGSDEKLEVKMYERSEVLAENPGSKFASNTRSVAIATASILGLSTILFLLTYIVLKYKQQRNAARKDSFCNEKIPSPVFEQRKSHKNNCSSRSISPMISNSNIYAMSTLDSHNGNDSPEYMWNSLRKPFQ